MKLLKYKVRPGTKVIISLSSILDRQCFDLVCVVLSQEIGTVAVDSVIIHRGVNIMRKGFRDQWRALKDIPEEDPFTLWCIQTEEGIAVQ